MSRRTIRRAMRRIARRAAKSLCLWINELQCAASERQIERLRDMRESATQLEGEQHVNQVRLSIRRQEIALW